MDTLGSRIRKLRNDKKLTQAQVAKASGASRASVTQWEQDANQPRGENLMGLAHALNCDPNWLLHGTGKNNIVAMSQKEHSALHSASEDGLTPPSYVQQPGRVDRATKSKTEKVQTNFIELDFYDVEVSAGNGALVIQEEKNDSIVFSNKFITKELGVNAKNVFLMPVKGDSMMPTLKNQAMVMVNRIEEFSGDGIYVFRFDGQLMVKRLQFTKHGLNVVSDNQTNYPAWELTRTELKTEDFEIIGEVIWSGQRM